jgi:hypothetical protein
MKMFEDVLQGTHCGRLVPMSQHIVVRLTMEMSDLGKCARPTM